MKTFTALVLLLIAMVQLTAAQLGTADVSPLLRNPAVVQKQIRCVLDQGPCDSTGKQLKAAIPEVISRNCAACSPAQAANARKVISFVQQRYPSVYSALQAKYRG